MSATRFYGTIYTGTPGHEDDVHAAALRTLILR